METPAISTPVLWMFRRIARGYFRRHFHGVRMSGAEHMANDGAPLIVYANHGSWWDPLVSVLLADRLMPQRRHYAPMDAEALERYAIFKHLGVFPVEMKSARGAAQFLRTGRAVLDAGGVLWVTPQGRFVDTRERPLEFKPGLAALAVRAARARRECVLLPLAIEYTFWDERLPECLLRFGEPVRVAAGEEVSAVEERLRCALTAEMNALREQAMRRDANCFRTLAKGRSGAGGFYSLGLRLKAIALRREYRPEHTQPAPVKAEGVEG